MTTKDKKRRGCPLPDSASDPLPPARREEHSLNPDWLREDPRSWPPLLLRAEVAAIARTCVRTVARATARNELRAATAAFAARARYRREDVLQWLGLAGAAGGAL